jgi:hypothetical protein
MPTSTSDNNNLILLTSILLQKEVRRQVVDKAAARLPFTVFKDARGEWRWIGIASSAAEDQDGETVSLKALEADTALKDVTGYYGPLNWWHTSLKLGTCDFNAMDGPLLVESGTFVSDRVAVAVEKAISEKKLQPGMSLEFEHNEPGPPVLPGRVFTKINKVGRALLPAEKASNLLTSFKVYSLKNAALADEKGRKKMLTEEKQKKALEIFGPDLLEALSNDNQVAVKMAEALNLSFKAMAPAAVVETPAPEPTPVPVVNQAATQATPDQPVEGAPEDGGGTIDPAALFESLTQTITAGVLAGLSTQQATATKETADALGVMTLALKENTTALNKVVAENVALKARLDALEGLQPPAVRARATQGQGVTVDQLPAVHKELVSQEEANNSKDPYAWASSLVPGLMSAPRG